MAEATETEFLKLALMGKMELKEFYENLDLFQGAEVLASPTSP